MSIVDPEDPVVRRRNLVWGWSLFALFLLLFAGTFGVALIYLWLD